jgi:hypothetical protein
MCLEGPLKILFVSQLASFQRSPLDRPIMTSFEVVEHHRHVSGARQRLAGVAAGYEDGLHLLFPQLIIQADM